MKSLIRFLLLALVVFVIVGFVRGWFTLNSSTSPIDNGKVDVNFTVDKDKMKDDAAKAKDKAREITHKATDKSN